MQEETEQQKQVRMIEEEKHNKRVEKETSYFHYNVIPFSFDCSQETAKKTLRFALKVKKEDRSNTLNWFIDKLKEMV